MRNFKERQKAESFRFILCRHLQILWPNEHAVLPRPPPPTAQNTAQMPSNLTRKMSRPTLNKAARP